ncbi:MAG: flavodoxin [Bacilli bacterium]|nr:flavodoxin [Bacilli bacterium]
MKKLVVYFSRTGENSVNGMTEVIAKGFTEIIAEKIAKEVKGELYPLVPVVPYPTNYDECVARSRREDQENARVEYIKKLENLDEYDVIYLGFPSWWRTYPRVVATFLRDYSFVGKTVYPFCTNEEGSLGLAELELKGAVKGAILKPGFACKGSEVENIDERLKDWLNK